MRFMRHTTVATALSACLSSVAPSAMAEDGPIDHPLKEHTDSVLLVDQDALRAGAKEAKPTSLWWDPAFAEQRAFIERQVALMRKSESDAPPFDVILEHGKQHYFAAAIPMEQKRRWGDVPSMFYLMDMGEADEAMSSWIMKNASEHMQEMQVAGLSGWGEDEMFLALDKSQLLVGKEPLVEQFIKAGGSMPRIKGSLAETAANFEKLVLLAAKWIEFEPAYETYLKQTLGEDWRQAKPAAEVSTKANKVDGWVTKVLLHGLRTEGLRTVDPTFLKRMPVGADISMVWSMDPDDLLQQTISAMAMQMPMIDEVGADDGDPMQKAGAQLNALLQAQTGLAGSDWAAALSGDMGAVVTWPDQFNPIPNVVVMLGLEDAGKVQQGLNKLLETWQPMPAQVEGATQAWTVVPKGMPVPLPVTLALSDDLVVLALQPAAAQMALAGEGPGLALDRPVYSYVDVDLPKVVGRWYPMLLQQVENVEETMGADPLRGLEWSSWQVRQNLEQNNPASPGAAMLEGDNSNWTKRQLASLFGEDGLQGKIDAHVAIWSQKNGDNLQAVALVVKVADGFYVFKDHRKNKFTDEASVKVELDGFAHALGPALADLAVLQVPETAVFNKQWLPSQELLLKHLPARHTMQVVAAGESYLFEERGLPVVGVYGHFIGMMGMFMAQGLHWQIKQAERDAKRDDIAKKHADIVAYMEKLGPIIQDLNQNGKLPKKASELAANGLIKLAETKVLFDGVEPTSHLALDKVGIWQQEPKQWPQYIWAVHLEEGWAVYVGPWGQVEVTNELKDIPPTPKDAATNSGDADSLF